jgi:hypothetical protein
MWADDWFLLSRTTAAASGALDKVKSATASGAKSLVANTAEMDVDINVRAPYILIPQGGDINK